MSRAKIPYKWCHALQKICQLNPSSSGSQDRPMEKWCNGQTLFCKSLGLKVLEWDGAQFDPSKLRLLNNEPVTEIIQTTRLGITKGHSCNENLEYRFIDSAFVSKCTKNPLTMRSNKPTVTIIQNYKPITSWHTQGILKKNNFPYGVK